MGRTGCGRWSWSAEGAGRVIENGMANGCMDRVGEGVGMRVMGWWTGGGRVMSSGTGRLWQCTGPGNGNELE